MAESTHTRPGRKRLMCKSAVTRQLGSWPVARLLSIALVLQTLPLLAEPVRVRFMEESIHGFLALRTMQGELMAEGDVILGDRVTSELTFRFNDGSVDSDTAVFSQHLHFRLISDHHVQKGPAFPKPTDMTINATTGQVTVRFKEKGEEKLRPTISICLPTQQTVLSSTS